MENKRKELLELDQKKKQLEDKITELTDYLTQPDMPGIEGKLIDKDGYPLANIDHVAVTTARHDLIYAQNDLKELMGVIEKKMASYFEEINNKKVSENNNNIENKANKKEEIILPGIEEENNNIEDSKIVGEPFAKISIVSEGSPAFEAGLKVNDMIIKFGNNLVKGSVINPLQALSNIVKDNINQKINIKIARKEENGVIKIYNKQITPHTWSGNGVLGCKLELIN